MPRSAVYFDFGSWGRWEGSEATSSGGRRGGDSGGAALYRQHGYARHEAACSCGIAVSARQFGPDLGAGPGAVRAEPANGRLPERVHKLAAALGDGPRAQRDQVGQLGDGLEV